MSNTDHPLFALLFQILSVLYGTAMDDYLPVSEEVVFPLGVTEVVLPVTIVDDSVLEDIEYLDLRITVPQNLTAAVVLDPEFAVINITDNDGNPKHFLK